MVDEPARVAGRDEPPEADGTPEVDRVLEAERGPETARGSAARGPAGRGTTPSEDAAEAASVRRPPQRHRAPSRRRAATTPGRDETRTHDDTRAHDDTTTHDDTRAHDATGPPADGARRIGPAAPVPAQRSDKPARPTRTARVPAPGMSAAKTAITTARDSDELAGSSGAGEADASAGPAYGHNWLDQDAGPVVRPYTVTGGRARPATGSLDLLSYVEALYAPEADVVHLQPEHRSILSLTRTALSVAEIAAHLDLPVGVVRVLIGDLVQANLVSTFSSSTPVTPPDESILQAVIDGLRAL